MAFTDWRRFNFFDLKKNSDAGKVAEYIGDVQITCTSSGHGYLVLGDSDGSVHLINKTFQISTFRAYDRNISIAEQSRESPFLVTIGEDEVGINPVIKVWNLDKTDRHGHPLCVRISRASLPNRAVGTSCLCLNDKLTLMAVGFVDGSIILYRGDITKERTNKTKILKDGSQSITGLVFRLIDKSIYLFVSTVNSVYFYNISNKDKEEKLPLNNKGCDPHCSVIAESLEDIHFMIARDDAVYCFTTDGKGPCYALEGKKILLQWFRNYLVIVSKETKLAIRPANAPPSSETNDLERHTLTVLDIQNKFIVYTATMADVRAVLIEWGAFYILTGDHNLSLLVEKDLQSKLALLFKKNLYDVSIRIVKSQQYDVDGLVDIFRQYGDHLYGKGDQTGAIEQYIKTIGRLEPSYVIRKYLQSHQIDNLTYYLQALHKQGIATADHTTLLLNCYTKLNKIDKLKEFIMTKDREVDFDVEVAINVCRQASAEDALLLAEKHGLHSWYLKIQIEDHQKYIAALDYIGKLEFDEAERNINIYGTILLQHAPKETTDFLKRLCTDYRPSDKPLVDQNLLDGLNKASVVRGNPEDFIHIFLNNSECLVEFLEHLLQVSPKCSTLIYNTLIEHYLLVWGKLSDAASRVQLEQKMMRLLESPEANYDRHQILIQCKAANFKPGILHLYEDMKMYQQVLQYHLRQQDYQSVLACCRRFGLQDPSLWPQALWAGAKDSEMPSILLTEILNVIEKDHLLSPLFVVDALCNWNAVKVGDIRGYLKNVLYAEEKTTDQEQALIQKYTQETSRIRKHVYEIQNQPIVFQGSRCSACNHQLELPSVHFFCQHSYHKHCFQSFAESENECPACLPNNKQINDVIKSQEQGRDLHEIFHSQLDRAEDGFSLVADYFGRGVFNKLTIVNDAQSTVTSPKNMNSFIKNSLPNETKARPTELKTFQNTGTEKKVEANPIRSIKENHYSLPVDTNISAQQPLRPSPKLTSSDRLSNAVLSPIGSSYPTGKNPFEEDFENEGNSKNPFEVNIRKNTNPFMGDDDEDENLNPFYK